MSRKAQAMIDELVAACIAFGRQVEPGWQTLIEKVRRELREYIAELEKALNIDTDLTIAGLRKELRDATTRIAELGLELGRKSVELGELVGENILWKVINDELKSRIAELEAERRWIPVNERMPDDWESVLTIDISKSTQDVVSAFYNPETSLWSTPFSSDLWVTHWMPLPEPSEVTE